jgi:beta-galactosidase
VYVNGEFAGHRPYGYSDFYVRLDQRLRAGTENVIRVEAVAYEDSRWYSGAGIYRNTNLIVGGVVHVALDGVRIQTPAIDTERAVIVVHTRVENDGATPAATTVRTEIIDPSGTVVGWDAAPLTIPSGRIEILRQRIQVASPNRWSVEAPNLYQCRTVLTVGGDDIDVEATTFGIRTLQLDAVHGLRVNGEPVDLRGACVHHDNGVLGAATINRADEGRVQLLKAAGFNAIRSAHHPMSKAMLHECDRVGMLVMDEAFDMWAFPKTTHDYAASFPDWWEADLEAMVVKDLNHPSVILYSIGNEIPDIGSPVGAAQGRAMADLIYAIDDTRFLTNAVNPLTACGPELFARTGERDTEPHADGVGVNTVLTGSWRFLRRLLRQDLVDMRTVESFAAVDVAGYNYLESRYELDHERHPNRIIVGTETFPTQIDANWKQVRDNPHVIGDFTWTGWDYLGEAGVGRIEYGDTPPSTQSPFHGPYPWLTAWTGDLDITGHRRPISYWREIVFGLRHDPYVAVRRPVGNGRLVTHSSPWSSTDAIAPWSWPGADGTLLTVEVYSDAEEVELLLGGVSVGRAHKGEAHRFRAEFEVEYQPGELIAIARRQDTEVGRCSLRTATGSVLLDVRSDRDVLRADDTDLAFVEIALVDAQGTVHTDADRFVTVVVEGPAVIQGIGSAEPCTEKRSRAPDTGRLTAGCWLWCDRRMRARRW